MGDKTISKSYSHLYKPIRSISNHDRMLAHRFIHLGLEAFIRGSTRSRALNAAEKPEARHYVKHQILLSYHQSHGDVQHLTVIFQGNGRTERRATYTIRLQPRNDLHLLREYIAFPMPLLSIQANPAPLCLDGTVTYYTHIYIAVVDATNHIQVALLHRYLLQWIASKQALFCYMLPLVIALNVEDLLNAHYRHLPPHVRSYMVGIALKLTKVWYFDRTQQQKIYGMLVKM